MDTSAFLDTATTAMPWITGGLAGALLTQFWASSRAKRAQPRLSIKTTQVDYSLPKGNPDLGELRVSYNGVPYERLTLYAIELTNLSTESSLLENPIVLTLGSRSQLIESAVEKSVDIPIIPHPDQEGLEAGHFRFRIGRLLPRDWVRIHVLASQSDSFSIAFRGDPRVRILKTGEMDAAEPTVRDVRFLMILFAAYIAVASFYPLSGLVASLLLIAALPVIIRLFRDLLAFATHISEAGRGQTVYASGVLGHMLVVGPGDSTVRYSASSGEIVSGIAGQTDKEHRNSPDSHRVEPTFSHPVPNEKHSGVTSTPE